DEQQEAAGEIVKNYIALARAWKSHQGIALNVPLNIKESYAPKKHIPALTTHNELIISTLNYPKTHTFKPGKPAIKETITTITPVYAQIGPRFKHESKAIITWIQTHTKEIKKIIATKGDITWHDIPPAKSTDTESLLTNNYLKIEKTLSLEDHQDITVVKLEEYYLDVQGASTHETS
ncbi:MAG: hypothetical protein KKG04_00500, partial [Candidatus Thermoplasmatota archaeon]|nr:hypothetical protein [Candidatus Thermoplasmatota archaeon]